MIFNILSYQETILSAEVALLQGTIQINFTQHFGKRFYVSMGENYDQVTEVVNQTNQVMNIQICNAELVEDPVLCYDTLYKQKIVTIVIDMPDDKNDYTLCLANIIYKDYYFSNCQLQQNNKKGKLTFTYTANYFNKDNTFYADCLTNNNQTIQLKADKKYQENQFITIIYDCSQVSKENKQTCKEYIKKPIKGCHFTFNGQFGDQIITYQSQFIKNEDYQKQEL